MPMLKASTSPFGVPAVRKPKAAPKHDALCITVNGFLHYCWCRCTQCWDPLKAKCVCSACRCYRMRSAA